jgi:hypothetical protein
MIDQKNVTIVCNTSKRYVSPKEFSTSVVPVPSDPLNTRQSVRKRTKEKPEMVSCGKAQQVIWIWIWVWVWDSKNKVAW